MSQANNTIYRYSSNIICHSHKISSNEILTFSFEIYDDEEDDEISSIEFENNVETKNKIKNFVQAVSNKFKHTISFRKGKGMLRLEYTKDKLILTTCIKDKYFYMRVLKPNCNMNNMMEKFKNII